MTEPCGCRVDHFGGGAIPAEVVIRTMKIRYCPLHAAAGEMLEMLKRQHIRLYRSVECNDCIVCDLIARAEGKR